MTLKHWVDYRHDEIQKKAGTNIEWVSMGPGYKEFEGYDIEFINAEDNEQRTISSRLDAYMHDIDWRVIFGSNIVDPFHFCKTKRGTK